MNFVVEGFTVDTGSTTTGGSGISSLDHEILNRNLQIYISILGILTLEFAWVILIWVVWQYQIKVLVCTT